MHASSLRGAAAAARSNETLYGGSHGALQKEHVLLCGERGFGRRDMIGSGTMDGFIDV